MDARIEDDFALRSQILAAHRVGMDNLFVLAMSCDEARRLPEQAHQGLVLIDKHIARAGTHEQLDAAHLLGVGLHDFGEVVVGGAEIEGIVGQRLLGGEVELLLQQHLRSGLRIGVGHIHERGHAASHGSTAFGVEVGLMGQAWLTEMHVFVNDAGDEVFACGVNDLERPFDWLRDLVFLYNLGNLAIRNKNTCHEGLPLQVSHF